MSNWITWAGGKMPVPKGTPIWVRHRNCEVHKAKAGEGTASRWTHNGDDGDIIAYRLRKDWRVNNKIQPEYEHVDVMYSDGSIGREKLASRYNWHNTTDFPLWRPAKSLRKKASESAPQVEIDPYAELKAAYEAGKKIENFNPVSGAVHNTYRKGEYLPPSWGAAPEYYRIVEDKPADPYAELKAAWVAGKTIQFTTDDGKLCWWPLPLKPLWELEPTCYRIVEDTPPPLMLDGKPINIGDTVFNTVGGLSPIVVERIEGNWVYGRDPEAGCGSDSSLDVLSWTDQRSPYRDFKIDEPVMVRHKDENQWTKRHFAGVTSHGRPMTWTYGGTSWSKEHKSPYDKDVWGECRRPTEDPV